MVFTTFSDGCVLPINVIYYMCIIKSTILLFLGCVYCIPGRNENGISVLSLVRILDRSEITDSAALGIRGAETME